MEVRRDSTSRWEKCQRICRYVLKPPWCAPRASLTPSPSILSRVLIPCRDKDCHKELPKCLSVGRPSCARAHAQLIFKFTCQLSCCCIGDGGLERPGVLHWKNISIGRYEVWKQGLITHLIGSWSGWNAFHF